MYDSESVQKEVSGMDLYVWHYHGPARYGETLFRNLVAEGAIEQTDICVLLPRYPSRDFYNLAFPQPGDTTTRWEYVSNEVRGTP